MGSPLHLLINALVIIVVVIVLIWLIRVLLGA